MAIPGINRNSTASHVLAQGSFSEAVYEVSGA